MATWKACFDESAQGPYYVMSGVMAPLLSWRSFEAQWRRALSEHPAIPYFSRKDAGFRDDKRSVFCGWSQTATSKKVARLSSVIRNSLGHRRVVILFSKYDFERAVQDTILPRQWQSWHLVAFLAAVRAAYFLTGEQPNAKGPPRLVFDHLASSAEENRALGLFRHLQEGVRESPGQFPPEMRSFSRGTVPTFRDDKVEEIGIQAADLVAWQYGNALKRGASGKAWINHRVLGTKIYGKQLTARNLNDLRWFLGSYLVELAKESGRKVRNKHVIQRTPWDWEFEA